MQKCTICGSRFKIAYVLSGICSEDCLQKSEFSAVRKDRDEIKELLEYECAQAIEMADQFDALRIERDELKTKVEDLESKNQSLERIAENAVKD